VYIYAGKMCHSTFVHVAVHITLSYSIYKLSSFVAFCYTFTKRNGKRYRDILQFIASARIYTYMHTLSFWISF